MGHIMSYPENEPLCFDDAIRVKQYVLSLPLQYVEVTPSLPEPPKYQHQQ